ncbi:hypothetical protein [Psychromonas aquimarina]|uniref:hypothetical protein n=1 Tax=Psychromonas aquimarina TaxID=444919 RepID=UPI00048A6B81|nr:hypothetical protein [Psychromonas aquimarina]
MLRKVLSSFSGILFCISAQANECTVNTVELSEVIRPLSEVVDVSSNKGTDGYETYLRQVVTYKDNSLAIIEQKNCLIHNLTVTLLSTEGAESKKVNRIVDLLQTSPLIQKQFEIDKINTALIESLKKEGAAGSGKPVSIDLSSKIFAKTIHSEVSLDYATLGDNLPLYYDTFTIYVAAGMND